MNKELEQYVNSLLLTENTPSLVAREEIIGHLEDAVEHFVSQGYSSGEATRIAIANFGDRDQIASELNQYFNQSRQRVRLSWYRLLTLATCISFIDIIIRNDYFSSMLLFSASFFLVATNSKTPKSRIVYLLGTCMPVTTFVKQLLFHPIALKNHWDIFLQNELYTTIAVIPITAGILTAMIVNIITHRNYRRRIL
ncbi:permease prefix domain 1-containing protein [Paenibacillus sp. SI8]|uniref:permease prefix domain 1-containing protein n=1 Tax=unclassified Paenibacillus TaxID=185978 RepID=UPI0034671C9A